LERKEDDKSRNYAEYFLEIMTPFTRKICLLQFWICEIVYFTIEKWIFKLDLRLWESILIEELTQN
jgi:hypothetical protein